MKRHARRIQLHDAEITSRQVAEMLRAGAGLQSSLSERDFIQKHRQKLCRTAVKSMALLLAAVYASAVLKEFFF